MRRVCVLAHGTVETGEHDCRRRKFQIGLDRAEAMLQRGEAERVSEHVIRLRVRAAGEHGGAVLPTFNELRDDTEHWVNYKKRSPNLTKEKQKFLRFMKGLAG
jgi:hypothetical protein